tara:strand:- start:793 stop:1326 length:534 start_codon:yes stop_codon:yes gene_type:complete
MKLEILSILFPKSIDMNGIGTSKSHDSVSASDIQTILSYNGLKNYEVNIILAKYFDDDGAKKNLREYISHSFFLKFKLWEEVDDMDEELISSVVSCSFMESTMHTCPFCNGVGSIILSNSITKCHHCVDGVFIFDDVVRKSIMKIDDKTYKKIKHLYEDAMKKIIDIEMTALAKLGC